MDEIMLRERIEAGYVLTREELQEIFDEFAKAQGLPLPARAGALLIINNIPDAALPEITVYITQALEAAQLGGPDGLIGFLETLDCPQPVLDMVRQYAESRSGD